MINLRDNVNLWGPPPSAVELASRFEPEWFSRYPGFEGGELVRALSRRLGISEREVTVGCGSDELIDAALGLAEPGSALVHPAPTFAMVPVYARSNRLRSVPVPFHSAGGFCVDALMRAAYSGGDGLPATIYLCSPNNPTGAAIPAAALRAVLDRAPGLVILDCAYAEFCSEPGWVREATRSDRLIVLHTFSKAWGLAGLRIGYAVGSDLTIARLRAARGPFSLNAVAEHVATRALELDGDWMRAHARQAAVNRDRLEHELRGLGLSPLRSSANFVLLPVPGSERLALRLLERGILVRAFADLPGIGDAIRIGVGPWELLDRLLTALGEVLPCE